MSQFRGSANVESATIGKCTSQLSVQVQIVLISAGKSLNVRNKACLSLSLSLSATAENDLNCLLRQLEEVENTMKQLELDDGGFTRRYSLASSSTTDPNTGCNPSPAPDAPEQSVSSPTLPPPLPPLSTNGYGNGYIGYSNGHINESTTADNQYSVDRVTLRPALPPRNLSTSIRPPSPPSTDYELAEEALMTTGPSFSHVVPHDAGLSGEAQSVTKNPKLMHRELKSKSICKPVMCQFEWL
ncbi:hypothetical protein ACTXT7_002217 [Hymenolepis weldensis]